MPGQENVQSCQLVIRGLVRFNRGAYACSAPNGNLFPDAGHYNVSN